MVRILVDRDYTVIIGVAPAEIQRYDEAPSGTALHDASFYLGRVGNIPGTPARVSCELVEPAITVAAYSS